MYTDSKMAIEELARRRKDTVLQRQILDYLGELPEGWPTERPIATLNRYLAAARMEDLAFAHAAQSLGLRPYWPTYLREKFTSMNPEKVSCVRPRVHQGGLVFRNQRLTQQAQLNAFNGVPMGDIMVGQRPLAEVHAIAREAVLGPVAGNVFDISDWNIEQARRMGDGSYTRRLAPNYYLAVMALYLRDGILFEDFDGGPNADSGLARFVDEVVTPAIKHVTSIFGLEPLIVRLPYVPGFSDFPQVCAPIFEEAVSQQQLVS